MVMELVTTDKGRATRKMVLDAAAREIEKNPQFRLQDAARHLGMRKSIYHYYFANKRELTRAVFAEVPRTPALLFSFLALSLEDEWIREELLKEMNERVDALGFDMAARTIGSTVFQALTTKKTEEG